MSRDKPVIAATRPAVDYAGRRRNAAYIAALMPAVAIAGIYRNVSAGIPLAQSATLLSMALYVAVFGIGFIIYALRAGNSMDSRPILAAAGLFAPFFLISFRSGDITKEWGWFIATVELALFALANMQLEKEFFYLMVRDTAGAPSLSQRNRLDDLIRGIPGLEEWQSGADVIARGQYRIEYEHSRPVITVYTVRKLRDPELNAIIRAALGVGLGVYSGPTEREQLRDRDVASRFGKMD
jgi:hypothetical protein